MTHPTAAGVTGAEVRGCGGSSRSVELSRARPWSRVRVCAVSPGPGSSSRSDSTALHGRKCKADRGSSHVHRRAEKLQAYTKRRDRAHRSLH